METIKLKHFCSVVETKSLSKSSKILGITHPGLHKSLKSLESDLGIKLTVPDGRGIAITPEALELYPLMVELVTKAQTLTQLSEQNKAQLTSFGHNEIFNFTLPNILLNTFREKSFSFHERCPGDIEPQIASGKLSIGLTTHPISHSGIRHTYLGEIQFSLYIGNKARFGEDLPFIIPSSLFNTQQRDHWKNESIKRSNVIRTNMASIAIDLAKESKGSVYIPDFVAEKVNTQTNKQYQLKAVPNITSKVPIYLVTSIGEDMKTKFIQELSNVIINSCCLEN